MISWKHVILAVVVLLLSYSCYMRVTMSLFKSGIWFVKGLNEYTKGGYLKAAKNFNQDDLNVDCTGKTYLITGSNSGLGKQVALELAKRGGDIHMVCRNPTTAEEARSEIVSESHNENVHVHILDLSKPKDVHQFGNDFKQKVEKLDVLVNNAGCMVNTRTLTDEGLEANFATNTLGTYIITKKLQELLDKADQPQVITVSSGGMLVQKLDVTDLQSERVSKFDGTMVYAQQKRQQVVITEQLSKSSEKIKYHVMHPGWSDTPAVRSSMPEFYEKMKDRLRNVDQGADTVLWLALQGNNKKPGQFWQDRSPVSTHLPLSWTQSNQGDDEKLMNLLDDFYRKFEQ